MEIEKIAVDKLIPYIRNPRKHSETQISQIAASIREFGFMNPVLIDGDYNVIAGHGRLLAAQKLGLKEVPCLRHDHLTETQKRAYILADNRLAERAEWDYELLQIELEELANADFDLDITGFDPSEIEDLLYIDHPLDTEHAGASPWERMAQDGEDGVMFKFGEITAKIPSDVYEAFLAITPEYGTTDWLIGVLKNASSDS